MINTKETRIEINSLALRILAALAMGVGAFALSQGARLYTFQAANWFSFAIYAFLLCEGNAHTSDKLLYFRRFAIFTVISEVCYDLLRTGKLFSTRYQSVMITYLVCLLIFSLVDFLKKKYDNMVLDGIVLLGLAIPAGLAAARFNVAFGSYGVVVLVMFYLARNVKYPRVMQALVLLYIAFYLSGNVIRIVKIGGIQYPISPEALMIAALPFIWMYRGDRGPNSLKARISYYFFLPVICLIMYAAKTLAYGI